MGKLTVTEFMTLDGVAQAPGGRDEDRDGGFDYGGWQTAFVDPVVGQALVGDAQRMDSLLLGRRTYDIFAAYWPTAPQDNPFTALLNRVPKYVASNTLRGPLGWDGTTLLAGPVADAVNDIKGRHDELHMIGSLDLLQALLRNNVVDRLDLWVFPVVLGDGKRVFGDGTVPSSLQLAHSAAYDNGTIHLVYEPVGPPSYANMGE